MDYFKRSQVSILFLARKASDPVPIFWRKIEPRLLMPAFVDDIMEVFGNDPADWYVTTGFRSVADSNQLYEMYKAGLEGRGPKAPKAAPGGKSPHNFGLAIDFVRDGDPETPRLQPSWDDKHPDWVRIRAKVDAHPRLHGGWHFDDGDHLEKVDWQSFKGWASTLGHSA